MKRVILLLLILVLGATFVISLVPHKAKALNNTFPDLNDTSGTAITYNVSAETQFVQKTDNNMRVWFPAANGTVRIDDPNFCASNTYDSIQKNDYFYSNTIPNSSIVTTYNFNNGASIQYGRKYASGSSSCGATITYSVTGIPATQSENGYYYINLDISYHSLHSGNCSTAGISGCDGIMNYYRIAASAGAIIGVRTTNANGLNDTGYDTTQQQVDTTPAYITYYGYFGTPCNISANTTAYLDFFDLDNAGGSGAQPVGHPVTVSLLDVTSGAYVNFLGSVGTVWTPPSKDNVAQQISFTAVPNHKYRLNIMNVYYNNTIQYSVPYSQIYYVQCKKATIDPVATVSAANISLGQSVTFQNYVGTSNTMNTGADSFDYAIGFTKPAAGATPAGATKAAATAPLDISLDPNRANATNGPLDTLTFTPSAVGQYCRSTTVSGYPVTYATVTPPNPASACVTVGPAAPPAGWQVAGETKVAGTDSLGNPVTGTAGGTVTLEEGSVFHFVYTIANSSSSAASTDTSIAYNTSNGSSNTGGTVIANQTGSRAAGMAPGATYSFNSASFTIPVGTTPGTLYCKTIALNPSDSTGAGPTTYTQACVKVGVPIPKCTGTISTTPARIQPGDSVVIKIGFNSSASPQTLDYNISGLASGSGVPIAAGQNTYTLAALTVPNAANTYSATWSISSATGNCSGSVSVVDMPYFDVFGGNVRSGGDFGGSCTGGGTLAAWHNNVGANNYGSGTQLSAIALVAITGFASKQTIPANTTPVALSFANTTSSSNVDSPGLGGNYGGSYCLSLPKLPSAGVNGASATFDPSGNDGPYSYNGDVTINNGLINNGNNVSLFVNGDLYITGDIKFSNTSWTQQDQIPSFVVVAKNIYIGPSVRQLDGLYVATDTASSADGNIYTCADASGPIASANLYGTCDGQLVVNGSFVAKRLHLMRAYGTLKDDVTNTGCHNAGGPSNPKISSCAGEVFQLSPELYLSNPSIKPQSNGAVHYDAISNLPPIL